MQLIKNLSKLRNQINIIDEKIIVLLSKRKSLYQDIAETKLIQHKPIRDLDRENELIKQLKILGKKYNINSNYIKKIFKIIIEDSVSTQQQLLKHCNQKKNNKFEKISYLGPQGSYSHLATRLYTNNLSKKIIEFPEKNFKVVLKKVEKKLADRAILPLENTCSGSINEVLDLLQTTNLFIIDELYVPIQHCLLVNKNTDLKDIHTIYSHPQPLEQCSNFINQYTNWKIKYTSSSSSAMEYISKTNLHNVAALGNLVGSKLYHLKVLKENIANKEKNITRFIVLSQNNFINNVDDKLIYKISLIIDVKYNWYSIIETLLMFKKQNLILTKIEIRPIINKKDLWRKVCFIDIQTNSKSKSIKKIVNLIYNLNKFIKILGCYPISKTNTLAEI